MIEPRTEPKEEKVQCVKCGEYYDSEHLVYIRYVGNVCDDCVENYELTNEAQ